jgi:ABC-type sugar transport system ATPase subunit
MLGSRFEGALEGAKRGSPERRAPGGRPFLDVEGLTVPGRLHDVSLTVGRGEVLGIAGLVGAGRSTLLRAIAGLEPLARGALTVGESRVPWPTRPRQSQLLGIALAPENRRTEGLVLSRSAAENIVLSSLRSVGRGGFATSAQARREAAAIADRVGFGATRLGAGAGTLSGGNQQKVVLAKCLRTQPALLLIDEPARGIDVGAKAEIFGLLRELSAQGMGVVMVSEETEELVAFADRVVVLCRGAVSGRFEGDDVALDAIVRAMFPVA